MKHRYGKCSAIALSALMLVGGAAAIRFSDRGAAAAETDRVYRFTFEEGEDLSSLELDGFEVSGGVLRRQTDRGGDAFAWLESSAGWRDVFMEFDYTPGAMLEEDVGYTFSAVLHKDPAASDWQASDRVRLRNVGHVDSRKLSLDVPNTKTTLNDNAGTFTGFALNTSYKIKIVTLDNRVQVFVNDSLELDSLMSVSAEGRIGFNSWRIDSTVDNLTIREAASADIEDGGAYAIGDGAGRLESEGDFSMVDAGTPNAKLVRTGGSGDARVWLKNAYWDSAKYEFKYKATGTSDPAKGHEFALMAGNADPASWQQGARVILRTSDWQNKTGAGADSVCAYTGANDRKGECITDFAGFVPDREYTIKAVFYGDKAQVSVDGELVLDANVGAIPTGRLGINSWHTYCELSQLSIAPATEADLIVPAVADSYSYDFTDAETAQREIELSGGFEIADGVLRRKTGGGDGFAWLKRPDYADAYYEFDLKMTGASADAANNDYGLSVIAGQDYSGDWQKSKRVIFHETTWGDKTTVVEGRSGFGSVEGKDTLGGFQGCARDTVYRIKVVYRGSRVIAYAGETKVLDAVMSAGAAGRLGFNSWQAYCEIDNLTIRRATDADLPEEGFESRDRYEFDFAEGSDVSALEMSGGFAVKNGALVRDSGSGDGFVWLKREKYKDLAFEMDFTIDGYLGAAHKDYGVSIVSRNVTTSNWQKSAFTILRANDWENETVGVPCGSGFVETYYAYTAHTSVTPDFVDAGFKGFAVGKSYKVKIVYVGAAVEVSVDSQLVMRCTVPDEAAGFAGINSWQCAATIDNLIIRRADQQDLAEIPVESKDEYIFDFSDESAENAALELGGEWKIADGALKRTSGSGDAQVWLKGNTSWRNVVVSMKVKFTGHADTDSGFSIVTRKAGSGWQSSNHITLRPVGWTSGGTVMSGGFVDVYNGLNTQEIFDDTIPAFVGFETDKTYEIKVMNINNRVRVYVDGVPVADVVSRERAAGAVGFNSWNSYAELDDLTVRTATEAEIGEMPAAPEKEPGEEGGGEGPEIIDPGKTNQSKNRNGGLIVGLSVGGSALALVGAAAGIAVALKRKKEKRDE